MGNKAGVDREVDGRIYDACLVTTFVEEKRESSGCTCKGEVEEMVEEDVDWEEEFRVHGGGDEKNNMRIQVG